MQMGDTEPPSSSSAENFHHLLSGSAGQYSCSSLSSINISDETVGIRSHDHLVARKIILYADYWVFLTITYAHVAVTPTFGFSHNEKMNTRTSTVQQHDYAVPSFLHVCVTSQTCTSPILAITGLLETWLLNTAKH